MTNCTLPRWFLIGMTVLVCLSAVAGCAQAPATPAPTQDEAANESAAAVLQAYREYGGEVVALDANTVSATAHVTDLTGTVPAYSLTQGDPPCSGFVRTAPSLVFTLPDAATALQVAFVGDQATNLIIVQEGEEIVCPEVEAATMRPEITLQQPGAGRYGVWVGRIDMDKPVNGQLTVTVTP